MLTVSRQFILFHNFLKAVKLADMIQQGINNPSDKDVSRRLCTGELALHSKRVIRGRADTTRLIANRSHRSSKIKGLKGPNGNKGRKCRFKETFVCKIYFIKVHAFEFVDGATIDAMQ